MTSSIRACTLYDVPWLCEAARWAYQDHVRDWSDDGAKLWIKACIASEEMIVMRGDGVACFAQIMRVPWAPHETQADIIHLFGAAPIHAPYETVRLVAAVRDRAKEAGCTKVYLGSIYEDLEPVALKLGATPLNRSFVWDLAHV